MSGKDVGGWISEGLIGRRSQFSTVIVFQTSDPKRLTQFLDYVAKSQKNKPIANRTLIYFVWRGLYEVTFREDPLTGKTEINYQPVAPQQQQQNIPFPIPGMQGEAIRSLEQALETVDQIFRSEEGVLFIIHGVFQRNDVLTAALRAWTFDMQMYEKKHTIAVFTENPKTLFDDDTLKYFIYIKVPASLEREREEILTNIAKTLKVKLENGIVHATAGLTLHEVESVALESIYRHRALKAEILAKYKNDIIKKSGILDIEEANYGFEAVGGYDVLKDFIKENVIKILQNPKKAEKLGLRPPRGLLLFGMGGTGKTLFAKALAKELKLPFLRLRTENIVSKWYGEIEASFPVLVLWSL